MPSYKDIKALELAKKAAEFSGQPPVNDEDFLRLAAIAEEEDSFFYEVEGDTIVMGLVCPLCYNMSIISAKELFIYSDNPSTKTVRLLKKFEDWARSKGATRMILESTYASPDSFTKYVTKKGYLKAGTVYTKDI